MPQLLRATDLRHFSSASRTDPLDSGSAVLERSRFGVLNLYHHAIFNAISLNHFSTSIRKEQDCLLDKPR